jgi:hypothetical protein
MLGIPFFAVWILEVVLFALAVAIAIWSKIPISHGGLHSD